MSLHITAGGDIGERERAYNSDEASSWYEQIPSLLEAANFFESYCSWPEAMPFPLSLWCGSFKTNK